VKIVVSEMVNSEFGGICLGPQHVVVGEKAGTP
jgi:hypothetical protein